MKEVNLISLVQAYKNIDNSVYIKYLKYLKINPKDHELDDLDSLVVELLNIKEDIRLFSNFYFGYSIPQIGKEFDLLRFGIDSIINIELKRTSDEEKIAKQLVINKYYLKFLGLKIISYTYISSSNKLYTLDSSDNIVEVDMVDLIESLQSQKLKDIVDINSLFNPSIYLVSPFNSTENFVNGDYFLTLQQEQIKKQINKHIDSKEATFIAISGKAGTGKSLLTYDIARNYIEEGAEVLVIHSGNLNSGHYMLNEDYGWNIIPAKDIPNTKISKFLLVVIDETQRIYPNQLIDVIKIIRANNTNCIFSFDSQQCLRNKEINNNIVELIKNETKPFEFELKEKIRTNEEIASFIKCLFDKSRAIHAYERKNVELNYFLNYDDVSDYLQVLKRKNWKIINYTPSRFDVLTYDKYIIYGEDTAHSVIGQEFDNVVAVIDSHFYYHGDRLSARNFSKEPYYNLTKMLFQIVTRTRRKLNLIIINNDEVMGRCLDILKT